MSRLQEGGHPRSPPAYRGIAQPFFDRFFTPATVGGMVLREVAFARQGKLGIEFEADVGGGAPTVKQILEEGLASALPR